MAVALVVLAFPEAKRYFVARARMLIACCFNNAAGCCHSRALFARAMRPLVGAITLCSAADPESYAESSASICRKHSATSIGFAPVECEAAMQAVSHATGDIPR